MNKIIFILGLLAIAVLGKTQTYKSYLIPGPINNGSGLRVPAGIAPQTKLVLITHISATEMASFPANLPISSFGFNYVNGVLSSAPVTGSLQVYFQHTSDPSYQKGTSWSGAISGMNSVYNGTMAIPACPTNTYVDVPLPTAYTYTGGAMYIAYEWTCTGPYASNANSAVGMLNCDVPNSCYAAYTSSNITPVSISGSNFRPTYRLGTINTYTNEAEVKGIISPAQLYTANSNTLHSVKAEIMNNSIVALNNLQVNLSVNGLVSHTDNVVIPSLAAGEYTTVTFSSYTLNPTVSGVNTISVSIAGDENNTNNLQSATQSVNCNTLELGSHLQPGNFLNKLGFGHSSGYFVNKTAFTSPTSVTGMNIAIANQTTNIGNSVSGVIMTAGGSIVAQSGLVPLTASNIGSYVAFNFPSAVNLTANTPYYYGIYQTANSSVGYSPLALTPMSAPMPMENDWYMRFSLAGPLQKMPAAMGIPAVELLIQGSCVPLGLPEQERPSTASVSCFPNPANLQMTIQLSGTGTNTNIDILNVLGQKVGSIKGAKDGMTYDISGFRPGVYFLKVADSTLKNTTYKFVVDK
ncbi:MAG: T9SS type A sorting domain-containing protein [Sediminibacterium sp.]|nr:T9SS type A sorting domain-containing protein [Sediminibacterium sp.]